MYCRSCGKQLHETARFCPQCGCHFSDSPAIQSPSLWMAITALVLSIFTLLVMLGTASDLDTLNALGELESAFGSHTLKNRMAEEITQSVLGGLVLVLPALVLGGISLAQQRGGKGMAIASLVISGLNLLIILGLFGLTLE